MWGLAWTLALTGPAGGEELSEFIRRHTAPITLNATDAEVGALLKTIARAGEFDVILSADLTARVSVRFREVPVGVALARVLELGGIEAGVSDGVLLAYPKSGVRMYTLKHVPVTRIQDIVKTFLSVDGKLTVDPKSNQLIVQDSALALNQVQKLIERLDRRPRQVSVEAAIISSKLDDATKVGVNLLKIKRLFDESVAAETLGFATPPTVASKGIFASYIGNGGFAGLLEALQETTDFKLLSHPKLKAMSGEPAEIRVGERLGFQTSTVTVGAGVGAVPTVTTVVQFLDVGTSLKFTAFVAEDGSVELELKPEVSEGSIDAQGLPSKRTSEMTTKVRIPSGSTLLLGGLIRTREEATVSQVPVLGSIPLLGFFFRSKQVSQVSDEVIVMITPTVEPEDPPTAAAAAP